jgi:hypothetical protein
MGKLVLLLLIIVYVAGGWKFWTGFGRTNFSQSRLVLTLFWPALLISKSFRQNFVKALKG